jgi:hypothetical protein
MLSCPGTDKLTSNNGTEKRLLTIKEFSARYGRSRSRTYELIRSGELAAIKDWRSTLVPVECSGGMGTTASATVRAPSVIRTEFRKSEKTSHLRLRSRQSFVGQSSVHRQQIRITLILGSLFTDNRLAFIFYTS